MIFDDRLNWKSVDSEHFIFKYPSNSTIEKEIGEIILKKEVAYKNISKALNVDIDTKFILYFTPSYEFCKSLEMIPQAAFPEKYTASLIYENCFPFNLEKFRFGHEIVHLLAYFWDFQRYHLELLEEGLARYLDQSGLDCHYSFLTKLQYSIGKKAIDFSLKILPYPHKTDYDKAGSFVKFLVEEYGMEKFKDIYLSSVLDRKNNLFYFNGQKITSDFLENLLEQKLDTTLIEIQRNWLSCIGIHL